MKKSIFLVCDKSGNPFKHSISGEYPMTYAYADKKVAEEHCERGEHVEEYEVK